jgi:hypothetical protein
MLTDPKANQSLWEGETLIQQLRLHNDLATFGEELLNQREIDAAKAARGMPGLADRALSADTHWADRIEGLHAPGHLLSFRGLYNVIYRVGSQTAHGSIAGIAPFIEEAPRRFIVRRPTPADPGLPYALVCPLLTILLTVVADTVKWIDKTKVQALNDLACLPGPLDLAS